jgi:ParB family chromosome partitioning protein
VTAKQNRLGRGLEALFTQTSPDRGTTTEPASGEAGVLHVPVAEISPNPYQPRRTFDPVELAELESSIKASGLLQPITVRPAAPNGYQLIAGERRLRAAMRLGWSAIPALVRELDDQAMLVLSLVENLQRADLHPLDEALGYRRLIDEFRLSQTQIADAVGKDRSTVANLLRVLTLPDGVQALFRENRLSLGHARALLALPNERAIVEVAREIIQNHLSVRDVERKSQNLKLTSTSPTLRIKQDAPKHSVQQPAEVRRLTELLRRRLQTDVRIHLTSDSRGEVTLAFYSVDDLQRLAELILGRSADFA